MWTDVVDLRDFYDSTLGQMACRVIRRRVREMWPDLKGLRVLGVGYATPYLRGFRAEAERVLAVMPASQGVLHWPPEGPSRVTLANEAELPFPDNSIDRVLLIHALESTEQLRATLREIWRILPGDGRVLAVVPNRRGIWARLDRTPFGHGHPFTQAQLSRLLRENMFTPLQSGAALFLPPSATRMAIAAAPAWEKLGANWFQTFAGVVLIEAAKEIYAARPVPAKPERRNLFAPVPGGAVPARRDMGNASPP